MEKDKSRGIKHIKDKSKYRNNTKKNPKYIPPKTVPNLASNWDRYENEEFNEEQDTAKVDFSILAAVPIGKGKHFQSKSDKLLASETESTNLSGLFSLDLKKLEESLLTIPFYERVDIIKEYLSENQIEYMKSEAEENLKKYEGKYFNKKDLTNLNDSKIDEEETIPNLDDILEKSQQPTIFTTSKKIENKSKKSDELEQWLDDFLNE